MVACVDLKTMVKIILRQFVSRSTPQQRTYCHVVLLSHFPPRLLIILLFVWSVGRHNFRQLEPYLFLVRLCLSSRSHRCHESRIVCSHTRLGGFLECGCLRSRRVHEAPNTYVPRYLATSCIFTVLTLCFFTMFFVLRR